MHGKWFGQPNFSVAEKGIHAPAVHFGDLKGECRCGPVRAHYDQPAPEKRCDPENLQFSVLGSSGNFEPIIA